MDKSAIDCPVRKGEGYVVSLEFASRRFHAIRLLRRRRILIVRQMPPKRPKPLYFPVEGG